MGLRIIPGAHEARGVVDSADERPAGGRGGGAASDSESSSCGCSATRRWISAFDLLDSHPLGLAPAVLRPLARELCQAVSELHEHRRAVHGGLELAVVRLAEDGALPLLLLPAQQLDRAPTSRQRQERGRPRPQQLLQEDLGCSADGGGDGRSGDGGGQSCSSSSDLASAECALQPQARSPGWCRAPEQLLGLQGCGAAADVFAVGCILGELATGQPLFPGANPGEQLRRMSRLLGPLPPAAAAGRLSARAAGLEAGQARHASALSPPPSALFRGGAQSLGGGAGPRLLRQWLVQRCPPGGATAAPGGGPVRTASVTAGEPTAAAAAATDGAAELAELVDACLALAPHQRPAAAELLRMSYFAVPAEVPAPLSSGPAAAAAPSAGPATSGAAAAAALALQAGAQPTVARGQRPSLDSHVGRSLGATRKWTSERSSGAMYGAPSLPALAERSPYALRLHSRTEEGEEEGEAPLGLGLVPRTSGLVAAGPPPAAAPAYAPVPAPAPAHPPHPTSARSAWGEARPPAMHTSPSARASGAPTQPGGLRGGLDVPLASRASPQPLPHPPQQRPGTPGTLAALTAQLRSWPLYGAQPVEGGGASAGGMARAAAMPELAGVEELVLLDAPAPTARSEAGSTASGPAPPTTLVLPGPSDASHAPAMSPPSPSTSPTFPTLPPAFVAARQPLATGSPLPRGAAAAMAGPPDGAGGVRALAGSGRRASWVEAEVPPSSPSPLAAGTIPGAPAGLTGPPLLARGPPPQPQPAAAVPAPRPRARVPSLSRSDSLESLLELEGGAAAALLSGRGGASSPGEPGGIRAFEDDSASAHARRSRQPRQRASASTSPPDRAQPPGAAAVDPAAARRRSQALAPEVAVVSVDPRTSRRRSQPLAIDLAAVPSDAGSRRRSQPLSPDFAAVSLGDSGWQQPDSSVGSGAGGGGAAALPRLLNLLQRELVAQHQVSPNSGNNSSVLNNSPSLNTMHLHLPAQPQPPPPPPAPSPPPLLQPPGIATAAGNGPAASRRHGGGPGRDLLNVLSEESADLAAHLPLMVSALHTEAPGPTRECRTATAASEPPPAGDERLAEGLEPPRSGGGGCRGRGGYRAGHGTTGGEQEGGAGRAASSPKGFARRARDRIRSYFSEDGGGGGGGGGPRAAASYERSNTGSGGVRSTGGGGSSTASGQSTGNGHGRGGPVAGRRAISQVGGSEGGEGGGWGAVGGKGTLVRTLTRAFKFGTAVRQKIAPLKEQPR